LPEAASPLPWEEALARFARENEADVMSDAFLVGGRTTSPARRSASMKPGDLPEEHLDQLCFPFDYTWNAESPLLLFRLRNWSLAREKEIPGRLARRWRQIAQEQGAFPVTELASMARLNNAYQFLGLRRIAGLTVLRTVRANQDLLRFYGALRPEQRALAHSHDLTADRLDVAQQELLSAALANIRPGRLSLPNSFVRLEARDVSGEPEATITLVFRDGKRETILLRRRAGAAPQPAASGAIVPR
jgi:hypothetical protein